MFEFEYSLFIDVDRPGGQPCLLEGKTSAALAGDPLLAQGDTFNLKLYFRRRGVAGAASTAVELAPGGIVFAGKHVDSLGEETVLFSASAFTVEGTGDDLRYACGLNLNTTELHAKIGTAKTLPVRIDVEVQDEVNGKRLTFQFDATVRHQVYEDEPPAEPALTYYTAAQVDAILAALLNIAEGKRLVVDADGNISSEDVA